MKFGRSAWVVEAACTFARRQHEGLLSSDDHHQLFTVFDYDLAYRYNVLGVEPVVIDKARQMANRQPLRAYDAVHLATAWLLNEELLRIEATIEDGVQGLLQSPQPPPPEAILTVLINEVATVPDRIILVLDDYHVIDAKPVDNALTFTLEHLPPHMHLVIATRDDPHLPLARLRASGQLIELRFPPDEAATFLNQVMGLSLSAEEITSLETRTEGWIAGLQMAALSMQGRADTASFIQAFTGSHRFILDYLVEEVLQRQPERVRSFLLQTSIPDRLGGPLCDAVTGQEDGRGMLEALERGNLFVVQLDDKRQWYRYHHLFADVLQARSADRASGVFVLTADSVRVRQ